MLPTMLLVFAATAADGTPIAPSFDCARAGSYVETTICAEPELADADRRMALLYAEVKRQLGDKAAVETQIQLDWLHERDACADAVCIGLAYRERIAAILAASPAVQGHLDLRAPEPLFRLFAAMTPDDLQNITTDTSRDLLSSASCRYFRREPKVAKVLFAAYFGSTRDAWQPLCGSIDVEEEVPETRPFLQALQTASAPGHCSGTMVNAFYRTQRIERILAVVDTAPDLAAAGRTPERWQGLGYRPDLAHWAQQGLWEKSVQAELERSRPAARAALAAYYVKQAHLDTARAAQVADYYLQRFVEVHILHHTGASSTLAYASLCLDRADLDRYLADGKVPDKACPYRDYADTSEAATLRRLLGLALVGDYPIAAVRRLIEAGASLNPERVKDEHPESPLMLAAARTDAIRALLEAGADPDRRNDFGKTALMYAVAQRNASAVRALLQAGASANARTDPLRACTDLKAGERTPLMYAAWHADTEIVHLLLDAQADSAAVDSNGETAAAYIARNADVDAGEREKILALLRARRNTPAAAP